jgi:hypothetical protein
MRHPRAGVYGRCVSRTPQPGMGRGVLLPPNVATDGTSDLGRPPAPTTLGSTPRQVPRHHDPATHRHHRHEGGRARPDHGGEGDVDMLRHGHDRPRPSHQRRWCSRGGPGQTCRSTRSRPNMPTPASTAAWPDCCRRSVPSRSAHPISQVQPSPTTPPSQLQVPIEPRPALGPDRHGNPKTRPRLKTTRTTNRHPGHSRAGPTPKHTPKNSAEPPGVGPPRLPLKVQLDHIWSFARGRNRIALESCRRWGGVPPHHSPRRRRRGPHPPHPAAHPPIPVAHPTSQAPPHPPSRGTPPDQPPAHPCIVPPPAE